MPCRLRITMSLMISIGEWEWTLMTCLMRYIYSLVCQWFTDTPPSIYVKNLIHTLFGILTFPFVCWSTWIHHAIGLACAWGENRYCKYWPFRWCAFWVSEEKPLCTHNFKQPRRWWHQMHHMSGISAYCESILLTVTISSSVQLFLY